MSWAHTHTERVRFGDLDAMKHLNNVVFLRYFETARIDYLNALMDRRPVNSGRRFGFIFGDVLHRSTARPRTSTRTSRSGCGRPRSGRSR